MVLFSVVNVPKECPKDAWWGENNNLLEYILLSYEIWRIITIWYMWNEKKNSHIYY